jgi:hypothetical protein
VNKSAKCMSLLNRGPKARAPMWQRWLNDLFYKGCNKLPSCSFVAIEVIAPYALLIRRTLLLPTGGRSWPAPIIQVALKGFPHA